MLNWFKPSCIFIYWQFQGCKLSCEYRLSKFLVSSYVSVIVRVLCVGRLASLCFLFRLCRGVCRLFCYDVIVLLNYNVIVGVFVGLGGEGWIIL